MAAHENLDFDALGSMVLAGRLYPGSALALVGGVEGVLREVLPLLEDRLDLVPASEIPLDRVREVRNTWQFFRDRRPDAYSDLTRP